MTVLLLALLALSPAEGLLQAREAAVEAKEAFVFAERTRTAAVLARFPAGARLRILGEENGWSRVELADGRAGWVKSSVFLKRDEVEMKAAEGEKGPEVEANFRPSTLRAELAALLVRGRIDAAIARLRRALDPR